MRLNKVAWPVLVLGLSAPMMLDCSAKDVLEGCDEFDSAAGVASLSIDANAKAFVQAAADLKAVATTMTAEVKTACVNIALGMGATDTWTGLGGDAEISNSNSTGACDVASGKIKEALAANADAKIALTISGAKCTVDANAQISCEANCSVSGTCTPGSIEARCTPGQLSGQCSGTCNASATCEGSITAQAQCQGKCEATCTGTCSGACQGTITGGCSGTCEGTCDGVATPAGGQANCAGKCEGKCSALAASATCSGKCEASCSGTCAGNCTLDATANINCGANVDCKGGCSVAYTAPKCEAELTPPACNIDANCQASCSSSAQLKATCTKPTINVLVTGNAQAITTLKTVLEANLPALYSAFKTQGALAAKAAANVFAKGSAVVSAAGNLGGKAIACVGVAAQASVKASASVNVSVSASASVSGSAGAS